MRETMQTYQTERIEAATQETRIKDVIMAASACIGFDFSDQSKERLRVALKALRL